MARRGYRLSRREFLIASSAAVAAACTPGGTASPSPSGSAAATATQAPKTLKIGQILPFSGVYTDLGNSMKRAADLYVKLHPTFAGRPVDVLYQDEANDATKAKAAATKYIESDQVDVIMGIVPTPIAYALRDVFHNAQMVYIGTNAGGDWLTRAAGSIPNQPTSKSPYVFRVAFSSWQISEPIGEWLAEKKGIKEAQLSYANYGFGQESAKDFREGFTKKGGVVKGDDVKTPFPFTLPDFLDYVKQIKANPTKATYHFYSGADAQKFLTTWGSAGMKEAGYALYGAGFLTEQDVLENPAAAKAAEGAITSLHWAVTLDNAENKAFVDAYQKEYSKLPDVFAVQAWDGMRAFDEAVKALKGDTSDKQKLIRALEDLKFNSPRGAFEFDKDTHNVIHNIYIRQVVQQGGKYVNQIIDTVGRVTDPGK